MSDFETFFADEYGPAGDPADATARAGVARRVRTARRRIGAVTTAAIVLAAVGAFGIARSAASDGAGDTPVVAGARARCQQLPKPVPRAKVPAEVRTWAAGRPVVGGGSLWTTRLALKGGHAVAIAAGDEGDVRRFKFGWLVVPAGPGSTPVRLTARAIDGPGRATGGSGLSLDGDGWFYTSTIEVTGPSRCWEITARHGDDAIVFRRLAPPRPR